MWTWDMELKNHRRKQGTKNTLLTHQNSEKGKKILRKNNKQKTKNKNEIKYLERPNISFLKHGYDLVTYFY